MSLTDSVLRTIRRHDMLPAGGRVAVALSGGPDSVALLHLLRELENRGDLVRRGSRALQPSAARSCVRRGRGILS